MRIHPLPRLRSFFLLRTYYLYTEGGAKRKLDRHVVKLNLLYKETPCSGRTQPTTKRPKFLQQPMSNCYNGYMVNNNNARWEGQKIEFITQEDMYMMR